MKVKEEHYRLDIIRKQKNRIKYWTFVYTTWDKDCKIREVAKRLVRCTSERQAKDFIRKCSGKSIEYAKRISQVLHYVEYFDVRVKSTGEIIHAYYDDRHCGWVKKVPSGTVIFGIDTVTAV